MSGKRATPFSAALGLEGRADPAQFYTNDLVAEVNAFDEPKAIARARALVIK